MQLYAHRSHYADHLIPVWKALSPEARAADVALVGSWDDLRRARKDEPRRIIHMEHGAGQSYGGHRHSADHPAYAGGTDHDDVGLFLVPNDHAANRWQDAYPGARVEVVGSPRLDELPGRKPDGLTTVVFSFHFEAPTICPEITSAFHRFAQAIRTLGKVGDVNVVGHSHPRHARVMKHRFHMLGIPFIESFDEVCRRADLYAADNTSTLFEFASTGRPVLVLNGPMYRRDVNHGLRFWDAASVGINVDRSDDLAAAVTMALDDAPPTEQAREDALRLVYAQRSGGAQRASDAVDRWLGIPRRGGFSYVIPYLESETGCALVVPA